MNSTNATAPTEEPPCPWQARREKSQLIYSTFLTYFVVLAASAHLQHALLKNRSQLEIVVKTVLTCLMPIVLWLELLLALGAAVHHYIYTGSLSKRYKVKSSGVIRSVLVELRFLLIYLIGANITDSGTASDQLSVPLYCWSPNWNQWNQGETLRLEGLETSVYVRIGQTPLICLTLLQSTSVFVYCVRRLVIEEAESTLTDCRCLWMSLTGILVCVQSLAAILLNVTLRIENSSHELPQRSSSDNNAERNALSFDRGSFRSGATSRSGQRSSFSPPTMTASMLEAAEEMPSSSTLAMQQMPQEPPELSDVLPLSVDSSLIYLVLARRAIYGSVAMSLFLISAGLNVLGKAPPCIWAQAGLYKSRSVESIGRLWLGACLIIVLYRIQPGLPTSLTAYAIRSWTEVTWYLGSFSGMYIAIGKMLSENQWPLAVAFTAALHLLEPIWVLVTPLQPRFWPRLRKSMLHSLYADAIVSLLHFLIMTMGDILGSVSDAYILDGQPWPEDVACPKLWKDPLFLPSV